MRSELSNTLLNVIKALKFIEKDFVEMYLHFHVKSFSMSFKALITFESALERSDLILFDHEIVRK